MNDSKGNALCSACFEANIPGANFCQKCGAPLSSYATTAPLEQIFFLGWMYRRALSHLGQSAAGSLAIDDEAGVTLQSNLIDP